MYRIAVRIMIIVERTSGMANLLFLLQLMNGTNWRLEIMIFKMENLGTVKKSGISLKSFGRKQQGSGVLKLIVMIWMVITTFVITILQETDVVRMYKMYCQ